MTEDADTITLIIGDATTDRYTGRYCKQIQPATALGASVAGFRVAAATMPTRHTVLRKPVTGLAPLAAFLESIRTRRNACVIRGALTEEALHTGAPWRRSLESFEDVPHHWVMFDLDGVALPEGLDWYTQSADVIRWVIRHKLPREFWDAGCYWQWSNSMGYKHPAGVRAHLWFWLAKPMFSHELNAWAWTHGWSEEPVKGDPNKVRRTLDLGIDPAVFRPVQPHITADPLIDQACSRPILTDARTGYLEGGPVTELTWGLEDDLPKGVGEPSRIWAGNNPDFPPRKAPRDTKIGFVNWAVPIETALEMAGYIDAGGGRHLFPGSESGEPGVVVIDNCCYSHHGGDPLHDGYSHDSWDVLRANEGWDDASTVLRIEKAVMDFALEQAMDRLNDEYAMVETSKAGLMVMCEYPHPARNNEIELRFQNVASLNLWLANKPFFRMNILNADPVIPDADPIEVQEIKRIAKPGSYWASWSGRREYRGLTLDPDPDNLNQNPELYNEFHGWPVRGRRGNWDLLKKLLLEGYCEGNMHCYNWLMDWLAVGLQRPKERYGVSLVTRGGKGVGKTTLPYYYRRLFGPHATKVSDMKRLTGRFNAHLSNKLLIHADEATWGGDKSHEGTLKDMITGETFSCEYKGIDVLERPNYMRFLITSNSDWVVPVFGKERRFFVLELTNAFQDDFAFFEALRKQMEEQGGLAAMMYELQHRQIETNQRKAPSTAALEAMGDIGLDTHELWLLEALQAGEILTATQTWSAEAMFADGEDADSEQAATYLNGARWPVEVDPRCAYYDYKRLAELEGGRNRRVIVLSRTQFSRWLGKLVCDAWKVKRVDDIRQERWRKTTGVRQKMWRWPSVEALRAAFTISHGARIWEVLSEEPYGPVDEPIDEDEEWLH